MDSVLLVSSVEKDKNTLLEWLNLGLFQQIVSVSSGGEARRLLIENNYNLVLINTPLSDEFGQDLALFQAESSISGIILFVKSEMADQIAEKVEDYGVVVLPKPISKQLFFQSLKIITASQKRLFALRNENTNLQQKIENIRYVDRAKCVLIQNLHMTEAQAHRYIEKHAMDMRVSKREVAEKILLLYEEP